MNNKELLERKKEAVEEYKKLDPTSGVFSWLSYAWMLSEVVTMLFNEKKRAIHDFIAGTVVVVEG